MIRAIHFSAIALLAAASLIAATSASSRGYLDEAASLALPGLHTVAAAADPVHEQKTSGAPVLDRERGVVTGLVAAPGYSKMAAPNG